MKKFLILPIALAAAGLTACSPAAKNETAEAADTIAADANATMEETIKDTDAATDNALGAAEATLDNGAAAVGGATDKALDKTGQAMKDAGNAIED